MSFRRRPRPSADSELQGSALTGRRQIMASGVWIAISELGPFVATAALSVVAGRVLGADLLGQQSLVAFCGALLFAVVVLSLTNSCIQTLASRAGQGAIDLSSLRRWVVVAHTIVGLFVGAALTLFGIARGQLVAAWCTLALAIVLDAVGWGYGATVIGTSGWGQVARRRLVAQLTASGLAIAAVLAGFGVTGIFAGSAVASLGLLFALRRLAPRAPGAIDSWIPRPILKLWGLFAAVEVLTQIVAKRIEFLFLGAYSSNSEIAAYSIAVMVVSVAVVVPGSLAGAAMPVVAAASGAGDEERARRSFSRALRVTAVASLAMAAVLVAVGPSLVSGLYGSQYERAAQLVPLVALGATITPVSRLCGTYWSALGKLKFTLYAGVFAGCVDLGAAFAFVPPYGASGAVVASLLGQTLDGICLTALTWKALGRFPLGSRRWLSALGCASAAAAVGRICADLLGGIPGAIAGGFCCLITFGAFSFLLSRWEVIAPLEAADGQWLVDTLPGRIGRPLVRLLVHKPLVHGREE